MNEKENNQNFIAENFSRRAALKMFGGAGLAVAAGGFLAASDSKVAAQTSNVQSNPTQGAGFYKFKVGALECFLISDGTFVAPVLPAFAVNAPRAEAENVLRNSFLPIDRAAVHVNALLVKTNNKIVLIDTGNGAGGAPSSGLLKANLQRAGIAPETVTDVVFTHAHPDHAGGNVDAAGKLNYPNARYHIAQAEWETWTGKNVSIGKTQVDAATAKAFIEITQRNLNAVKDRVSLFKPGAEIVTGVASVAAAGHTPGHTAFLISSGSESLLHAGDFAHHFVLQLQNPDWYVAFDYDPQQAVAARKRLLDRAAADRTLIVGSHIPFPGVGNIRARTAARNSFEWVPVVWQWQP